MTAAKTRPRKILLDTNCFLRLYCSPVLPLMQQTVEGYQILTLEELGNELFTSTRLKEDYPWIASDPKAADLKAGYLRIRGITKQRINQQKIWIRPFAKATLEKYCTAKRINPVKQLSTPDVTLLAAAVETKAVIATDDWPLRLVTQSLLDDPDEDDDTYDIGLMSTLDVLAILEQGGLLTADTRMQTVEGWMRKGENLLRGWQQDYEKLFGEEVPKLD